MSCALSSRHCVLQRIGVSLVEGGAGREFPLQHREFGPEPVPLLRVGRSLGVKVMADSSELFREVFGLPRGLVSRIEAFLRARAGAQQIRSSTTAVRVQLNSEGRHLLSASHFQLQSFELLNDKTLMAQEIAQVIFSF